MTRFEQDIAPVAGAYADVIGGACEMAGCVGDGDLLTLQTPPGCWGPMITPCIRGGHEVTRPIRVENAVPGDTVALILERVRVLSEFAASGTGRRYPERFGKDPSVHAICPHCNLEYPETVLSGTGEDAIRCSRCGNPIIPQTFENGYTVAIDGALGLGVAAPPALAAEIAQKTLAGEVFLPEGSRQHLATILGAADLTDLIIRGRPMVGNIGCAPAVCIPSSKNSGDLLASLNATGLFEPARPCDLSDGHMDLNSVTEGSVVLSPVLLDGAGIYAGDVHLAQGDGELAGHTLDVSAEVRLRVRVLKGLSLEGPVILPAAQELEARLRPFTQAEYDAANGLLGRYGYSLSHRRYPVQVVGSADTLGDAIDCAVRRASRLTGLPPGEIKNLATVGGGVKIGRTTGSVCLTLMLTEETLGQIGILELVRAHYA